MTPGAVLFGWGVDRTSPARSRSISTVIVLIVVVSPQCRATAEASYLVAVTASQLLSPVLWDHYAMLLLLPVAYLLSIGSALGHASSRWRHRDTADHGDAAIRVSDRVLRDAHRDLIVGWRPAPSIRAAEPSFA